MSTWPEPCPRCGSYRLIGREAIVAADAPPRRLRDRLRWWRRPRGRGAMVRHTYHCEMCGYQWTREVWRGEDQA